ncbi:hypothetical protein M3Y99_00268300 [Aphelenchoides fujianensis]|nr:hypothetical protein M3Y99_00268300 [Aphelenchoides fujianensis]
MANFESRNGNVVVFDTAEWVAANQKDFVPPVCNKCMFSDQLKVFFVGGPNSRNDYHLEEGEEIFFQIKGDMVLKVVERGQRRDVRIKEGELFLLPAFVEHSPQRFADTLGCVVERDRSPQEFDCVRYFVDESNNPEILWERWFHLKDVVKDLPPVIRAFNESDEKRSGRPGAGSFERKAPYEPKPVELPAPLNLAAYIDEHLAEINKSPHPLFEKAGTRAILMLYGQGSHELDSGAQELRGSGELVHDGETSHVDAFFTTRIKPHTKFTLRIADGVCLIASITPK